MSLSELSKNVCPDQLENVLSLDERGLRNRVLHVHYSRITVLLLRFK